MRSIGGTMYLSGVIVMAYNLARTMLQGKLVANEAAQAMPLEPLQNTEATGRCMAPGP